MPFRFPLTCLFLLATAGPLRAQAPAASLTSPATADVVTTVTGARLIDGTGRPPVEDAVLVFRGERILAVGPAVSTPVPPEARGHVLDARGKTLIPGLLNAHGHLGLTKGETVAPENFNREHVAAQLAQYERYGVTAVLSLGNNDDVLYAWREEQRAGRLPGADIFTADRGLGVPRGAPPLPSGFNGLSRPYRPDTPEAARAAVREMAARRPDVLKLWLDDFFGKLPKMRPEVFQAAVGEAHAATDEAHRHGLRMAAHVFYLDDAKALLGADVDVLAHSVRDRPVDAELIAALKARDVPYVPTLTLDEAQFVYAEHPAWMDEPFFIAAVDPALLEKWRGAAYAETIRTDPATPKNRAALATGMANAKTLHDAGVFVALGTDSGAMPTRLPGFAEHRELQLLVQAGLTPLEAIVCATAHAARVLGAEGERGTLEPGKRADFLLLGANPLDDIKNTTRLAAIYHGGRSVAPVLQDNREAAQP